MRAEAVGAVSVLSCIAAPGVLYPAFGILLSPVVLALSPVSVIATALRVRAARL